MKILKIDFKGWTATPRDPTTKIGTINCLMTPSYSMLIGLIECCVGEKINVKGLKLGFWYCFDRDFSDLETTRRLQRSPDSGNLSKNKDMSVTLRKSHVIPQLTLFLNRLEYKQYFESPVGIPSLGQSQDLIWIEKITVVDGKRVSSGTFSSGMVLMSDGIAAGEIVRCADSFVENEIGEGRHPRHPNIFISINGECQNYKSKKNNIFTSKQLEEDVYLYQF